MKKLLKGNIKVIVAFVLGLLIAGGVGVYAFNIASTDVSYDNATSGLEGNNVKDALDDLYTKSESTGEYDYVLTTTVNYAATDPVNIVLSDYSKCHDLTADDVYLPQSSKYYDQGSTQWSHAYGIVGKSYNADTCTLTLNMGRKDNTSGLRSTYYINVVDVPIFVKAK